MLKKIRKKFSPSALTAVPEHRPVRRIFEGENWTEEERNEEMYEHYQKLYCYEVHRMFDATEDTVRNLEKYRKLTGRA